MRDAGAVEGHDTGFVAGEVVVAGGDDVADVVAVEAGDDGVEAALAGLGFEVEGEFAAEIAGGGNPDGAAEAKGLRKLSRAAGDAGARYR